MNTSLLERWTWPLIYVSLFLLGIGLTVLRGDVALGWVISGLGIAGTVMGIVLIWLRSRVKA